MVSARGPLPSGGCRVGRRTDRISGRYGGIVFGQLVGYLLDHGFGYGPVLASLAPCTSQRFSSILAAIPAVVPLRLELQQLSLSYGGVR